MHSNHLRVFELIPMSQKREALRLSAWLRQDLVPLLRESLPIPWPEPSVSALRKRERPRRHRISRRLGMLEGQFVPVRVPLLKNREKPRTYRNDRRHLENYRRLSSSSPCPDVRQHVRF